MKKITLLVVALLLGFGAWRLLRPTPASISPETAAEKTVTTTAPERAPAPAPLPTPPKVSPSPALASKDAPPVAAPGDTPTLAELLLPGNRIFDSRLGFMMTFPKEWTIHDTKLRWGVNEGENTIWFAPPAGAEGVVPSVYYRKYSDGTPFDATNAEARLRDMARQKEVSRSGNGQNDYKNDPDSFVFRSIGGNPSLSYFATFTGPDGQVGAEYFLRVLGPTGYVMFFNRGPVKDVQALIPTIVDTANTVKPP